jgi:predicted nucleotidyltransferase
MIPIIKTKLRSKLLSYYFLHPDESYYVREIASLIVEDPGNLSRELRSMEKEGIFISRLKGRIKLYSLNKAYPLFNELKNIVFKTEGAEGSFKKLVLAHKDIEAAFIYGSFAKNSEKKTSDIDIVVIGKFDRDKFTRELRSLESKLSREINFTAYKREEFDKKRKEEGGFLNMVLAGKIILLKGSIDG